MTDKPPLLGRADAVPRRRWRWLLPAVVAAGAVLLITSLVVRAQNDDQSAPVRAVDAYLDALEANDALAAYNLTCADLRRQVPFEDFVGRINRERADAGGVVGHKIAGVQTRANGTVTAYYTVQHRDRDVVFDVVVTRDAGAWKLCGFRNRSVDTGITTITN